MKTGPPGSLWNRLYPQGPDPKWVYVGNLNSVVRFPYANGDLEVRGPAETVLPVLTRGGTGGHTTRDVVFSLDGSACLSPLGPARMSPRDFLRRSLLEIAAWEKEHGARGRMGS